jgi:hypothetical protein
MQLKLMNPIKAKIVKDVDINVMYYTTDMKDEFGNQINQISLVSKNLTAVGNMTMIMNRVETRLEVGRTFIRLKRAAMERGDLQFDDFDSVLENITDEIMVSFPDKVS